MTQANWFSKKVSLSMLLTVSLAGQLAWAQAGLRELGEDASLQNVLRTALVKNPKIKANDLRVAAASYDIEAKKLALLPTFTVGYSRSNTNSRLRSSDGTSITDITRTDGARASINLNLFSGFADYYAIKAAQCRYQEKKATYESTDSFIKNTRGEHANSVMKAYLSLVQLRSAVQFQREMEGVFGKLLKGTSNDGKALVESKIQSLKLSSLQINQSLSMIEKTFRYLVKEDAPANLPPLESIIDSIHLPATAKDALPIALQKSPEMISANLGVECMKLNYKEARSRLLSPSVDLTASVGSNRGSGNHSTSTDITLSFSWSFQPRTVPELKAMGTQIQALEEDRKGVSDDLAHEIDLMYPQMENTVEVIQEQMSQYKDARAKVEEIMKSIDRGQVYSGDSLNSALSVLDSMTRSWSSLYGNQYEGFAFLISTKFGIQKTIGTLFESLGEAVRASEAQPGGPAPEPAPTLSSDVVISK